MEKNSQNFHVFYWIRNGAKICVSPIFSLFCLTCSTTRSAPCQLSSSVRERHTVSTDMLSMKFIPSTGCFLNNFPVFYCLPDLCYVFFFFISLLFFFAASIVLGVPTVKRESQSYLLPTLASLIASMNEEEKNDTLIIVFVAEVESDFWEFLFICSNRTDGHNTAYSSLERPN